MLDIHFYKHIVTALWQSILNSLRNLRICAVIF